MCFHVVRFDDIIFSGTYEECENHIENYCKIRYTDDLLAGNIYIVSDYELNNASFADSELTEEDIPY